ncbi:MAG: hypothetical protein OEY36_03560 [Gammaproteobacteria bacterium]|nr:hypothetical protein [Gammaproteobacteria bacterium]
MDIQSETQTIYEFVQKGNFHAAMNITISALNECRRSADQSGVNSFLNIIKDIAEVMSREFGQ